MGLYASYDRYANDWCFVHLDHYLTGREQRCPAETDVTKRKPPPEFSDGGSFN